MQTAKEAGLTPIFYMAQVEDKKASRKAGRPIFVDQERIEYRFAANRHFNFHDLAHGFHEMKENEVVTHAMRFPEAYRKFKETGGNEAVGTPLQNLPGLTAVQISTLKALAVYTVEALASLEGQQLKNLGPNGHVLKQSAQKYLAAAGGRTEMSDVLKELAALKAQNDELARIVAQSAPQPVPQADASEAEVAPELSAAPYADLTDDDIKAKIKEITGSGVRGQPSRATLEGMLRDLESTEDSA